MNANFLAWLRELPVKRMGNVLLECCGCVTAELILPSKQDGHAAHA
jgi:hypothetical protein